MKKNILYITHCKKDASSGVWKKVIGQSLGILKNNIGCNVFLAYTTLDKVVCLRIMDNGKEEIVFEKEFVKTTRQLKKNNLLQKVIYKFKRYSEYSVMFVFFAEIVRLISPRLIYIRSITPCTKHCVELLKNIKRMLPDTKIFWEIPTYPARAEFLMSREYAAYLGDLLFFKKIVSLVDKLVLISLGKVNTPLENDKTIYLSNGIDVEQCKLKKINYQNKEDIAIICVAHYRDWHGYDRLLAGLSNYYKKDRNGLCKRKIAVHFVGSGMEKLESLSVVLGLQNYVKFYGAQSGESLDSIYANADLAVATLGMYRKQLFNSSDLKIREYIARGIPYISCCEDIGVPSNFEYKFIVPNDNSPININNLVCFHDKTYSNKINLIVEMRRFAEQNFSWASKMHFVKL